MNLLQLDPLLKNFLDKHTALQATADVLDGAIKTAIRAYMPGLKRQSAALQGAREDLENAIKESPDLFVKPRTITMRGVKFGFAKGKGKIDFDDPAQVVALIKKHFPSQKSVLIHTKETPDKDALQALTTGDLKKLGCTVEETGDRVVIQVTDSGLDKLLKALMKQAAQAIVEESEAS